MLCLSKLIAAVALVGSMTVAARANDSAAHLGAGGLEFTSTTEIVMERQDLYLSPHLVKVDYVLRNVSDRPVRLRVAFPLPRLDLRVVRGCSAVNIPFRDDENFLGFSTHVDGRPVRLEKQIKAFANDAPITDLLAELGLDASGLSEEFDLRFKQLGADELDRLAQAGAVERDRHDCQEGYQPAWTAETIYDWEQEFRPGVATRVSHQYRPSLGSFFIDARAKLFGPSDRLSPRDPDLSRFCVDEATWRGLRSKQPGSAGSSMGWNLEFLLRAAGSWPEPIREFKLTIDKGSPQTVVSLCANGLRKTGPTTFELRRRDFVPSENIDVLFVGSPGSAL